MPTLRINYQPEDEWHGELHAHVEAHGFAGHGAAWFSRGDLDTFCEALGAYPLPADHPPTLQGGYWSSQDERLDEINLQIRVEPLRPTGRLVISVIVADRMDGDDGPPGAARRTQTWFEAGYNDLSRFQSALRKLLAGTSDEALLEPETT